LVQLTQWLGRNASLFADELGEDFFNRLQDCATWGYFLLLLLQYISVAVKCERHLWYCHPAFDARPISCTSLFGFNRNPNIALSSAIITHPSTLMASFPITEIHFWEISHKLISPLRRWNNYITIAPSRPFKQTAFPLTFRTNDITGTITMPA
jgi:hypothetical protein